MAEKKDSEKNIHEGHRERLRKKIMLTDDAMVLTHEMLEALLFYVIPVRNTNPLAHRIINTFGSVSEAMDSGVEELMKVSGVGEKTAQYLAILGKFGKAYSKICHQAIEYDLHSEATKSYIKTLFHNKDKEQAYILYLDSDRRIVKRFFMFEGKFGDKDIDVKDIIDQALMYNLKEVICIHNHINGEAKPSHDDMTSSLMLKEAFSQFDITLFDSLIYTNSIIYSIFNNTITYFNKDDAFA